MSDTNILDTETSQELSLTSQSIEYIRTMAKWGTFLSIVGFVFIGLLVIIALFAGAFMSQMGEDIPGWEGNMGFMITGIYLFLAAIYIYPTWKLFQFSRRAKSAITRNNTIELTESLGNLKSVFSFMGILTAIILGFYALMIVIGMLGGLAALAG